jgi:serine/threonine protein kinase
MNPDNPEVGSLSYMAPELLSGIKIYFYLYIYIYTYNKG